MPELPEVETVCRQLEPLIQGRTVTAAGSHPSKKFVAASQVLGRAFCSIRRRGKFILFELDNNYELVAHLGMTGVFQFADSNDRAEPNTHRRAWWGLDDERRLEFIDIRRFGRLAYVKSGDYSQLPTLARAGPEPFDSTFDGAAFTGLLRKSRSPIKVQLLSQRPIAGVGNIYADEALWLARINPKARRVGPERAETLLAALREVLSQGITNGGTTLRDYRGVDGQTGSNQYQLRVYGRAGKSCFDCPATLKSEVLGGRTTTWCPHCQAR